MTAWLVLAIYYLITACIHALLGLHLMTSIKYAILPDASMQKLNSGPTSYVMYHGGRKKRSVAQHVRVSLSDCELCSALCCAGVFEL